MSIFNVLMIICGRRAEQGGGGALFTGADLFLSSGVVFMRNKAKRQVHISHNFADLWLDLVSGMTAAGEEHCTFRIKPLKKWCRMERLYKKTLQAKQAVPCSTLATFTLKGLALKLRTRLSLLRRVHFMHTKVVCPSQVLDLIGTRI